MHLTFLLPILTLLQLPHVVNPAAMGPYFDPLEDPDLQNYTLLKEDKEHLTTKNVLLTAASVTMRLTRVKSTGVILVVHVPVIHLLYDTLANTAMDLGRPLRNATKKFMHCNPRVGIPESHVQYPTLSYFQDLANILE